MKTQFKIKGKQSKYAVGLALIVLIAVSAYAYYLFGGFSLSVTSPDGYYSADMGPSAVTLNQENPSATFIYSLTNNGGYQVSQVGAIWKIYFPDGQVLQTTTINENQYSVYAAGFKPGTYEISVDIQVVDTDHNDFSRLPTLTSSFTVEGVIVRPYEYVLEVSQVGYGQVQVNGVDNPPQKAYTYNTETPVVLAAYPTTAGWRFDHWVLPDGTFSGSSTQSFTVNKDLVYSAVFLYENVVSPTEPPTPPPTVSPSPAPVQYALSLDVSGSGAIKVDGVVQSGTKYYDDGVQVQLSASASAGYSFSYYLMNNGEKKAAQSVTLTMDQSRSALAVFVPVGVSSSVSPTVLPTSPAVPEYSLITFVFIVIIVTAAAFTLSKVKHTCLGGNIID